MKSQNLEAILAARAARRPIVRLVWLGTGEECLLSGAAELGTIEERAKVDGASQADAAFDAELVAAVASAFVDDEGGLVETARGPVFVQPFNPSPRLAIVGAVHIAQSLSVLARDLGHAVLVIDPRRGFLTEERFPGVAISHAWPDEALAAFGLDPRSAVVTLSHDAKLDDPALDSALRSNCYYIAPSAAGAPRPSAARASLRPASMKPRSPASTAPSALISAPAAPPRSHSRSRRS